MGPRRAEFRYRNRSPAGKRHAQGAPVQAARRSRHPGTRRIGRRQHSPGPPQQADTFRTTPAR
eukprot:1292719-Alexandrium_andersonii.AAC.1